MKPATEVGGDYYDFHVGEDGTLTVAVGDATGHGLKAGTMVTATKSLFNNLAARTEYREHFQTIFRRSEKDESARDVYGDDDAEDQRRSIYDQLRRNAFGT